MMDWMLKVIDLPRETALSSRGPTFIHASIAMREQVLPMVAPGAANKDMIGG